MLTLLFPSTGMDFALGPVLLVFGSQTTLRCASVNIVNDCVEENSEYSNFCLYVSNLVRAVFGRYNLTTLVIEDNDSELYTNTLIECHVLFTYVCTYVCMHAHIVLYKTIYYQSLFNQSVHPSWTWLLVCLLSTLVLFPVHLRSTYVHGEYEET